VNDYHQLDNVIAMAPDMASIHRMKADVLMELQPQINVKVLFPGGGNCRSYLDSMLY
jgi:hypothetical protein